MTIDEEMALRRCRLDPHKARSAVDAYFRKAVKRGVFDEDCDVAKSLLALVHAAISLAEDDQIAFIT